MPYLDAARKREHDKQYRKQHAEKRREQNRLYKKANPDQVRVDNHNRRVAKRASGGSFTAADIERIYSEQKGLCAYCAIELNGKYHIDHIHPLSRGGSNWPENLACACERCNLSKSDKTLEEWRSE